MTANRKLKLQRWAFQLVFVLGGLTVIWFGIRELLDFLRAVRAAAGPVDTESIIFGVPFFGIFFVLTATPTMWIAPPPQKRTRARKKPKRIADTVFMSVWLGCAGLAILLATFGGFLVNALMTEHGFHQCSVSYGRKVQFKTWAPHATPCPPETEP
ncbi:hypothetical protein ACFSGX_06615 [Sphingomonas arantia]|uniref:DUF1240 domain-containing protein n=1 Tax=Sphingomonas arantia TaxID=1460676 RepID=A0ABW4TY24_9SPHN